MVGSPDLGLNQILTQTDSTVYSVSFSPDGNYIAYASMDDNVYVHNTNDWNLETTLTEPAGGETGRDVYSVSFSPDGNYIAYGSGNGDVYVHSTSDWSLQQTLTQANGGVKSVAFSPDGDYIAYGEDSGEIIGVYIHNTDNWSHEQTLTEAADDVRSVTFSPDSSYIAYGGGDYWGNEDYNVYIHDMSNWGLITTLTQATREVSSLAFSPDGNYIAYGSDKTYVHKISDWSLENTLNETGSFVNSVSFSPYGNYIVYGSGDNDVYIHDISNWNLTSTLTHAGDGVRSVAFSPKGNYIAYGEKGGGESTGNGDVYVHNFSTLKSELLGEDLNIVNGSDATYEWSLLNASTNYNWYAEVTDGTDTITSDTWNFTTGTGVDYSFSADDFTSDSRTSDFSGISDLTNVTNMTVCTGFGCVNYPNRTNVSGQDLDSNIIFGDCYVAVNSTNLDYTFNATAYLLMNNSDGHCGDNTIFTSNQVVKNARDIKSFGRKCEECEFIKQSNELSKYRVPHFSSYAIGSNSNLTTDDNGPKALNQNVTFTAVYRNVTDGQFINGANCELNVDGSTYTMIERTESYVYNVSFIAYSTYDYNVTCSATGYQTLSTNDTVEISQAAVPEFNGFVIIGLLAAVVLIVLVRKRK